MSRRKRIHVERGYYLLAQRASGDRSLLEGSLEAEWFVDVLRSAAVASGVRVLAWCVLPASMALVVQIGRQPVGSFVRRLASDYARRVNRRRLTRGHVFAQHHRSVVLSDDAWLLEAIRYVHWLPVIGKLVREPAEYAHSTHAAYVENRRVRHLLRHPILRQFSGNTVEARHRFREWSRFAPAEAVVRAFAFVGGVSRTPELPSEDLSPLLHATRPRDVRAIGRSRPSRAFSLDALSTLFIQHLSVRREDVFSTSRRRELVYVRALIADHALRAGAATLSQAARYFRRDPSTLLAAITHYRNERPELFRAGTVQRLIALDETPDGRLRSGRSPTTLSE